MTKTIRNQIILLFNQSQIDNTVSCNIQYLDSNKFIFEITVQSNQLITKDIPTIKRNLINHYYRYIIFLLKLINQSTSKINVYQIHFFNMSGLYTRNMVENISRHWFANQILELQEYQYDSINSLNLNVINQLNQDTYTYSIENCIDPKLIQNTLDNEIKLKLIANNNHIFNLQSKT